MFMSVSPDGRSLVYQGEASDGRNLWLHSFVDGSVRGLPGTEGTQPFWSPDGRFVAFHGGGRLRKVDVNTGAVQTICDSRGTRGTWSRLAVGGDDAASRRRSCQR
jgi:Tol biopolymer transport system component